MFNKMEITDDILLWLLEDNNPSVRYFILTELLGKTEKDSEVIEAKNKIMKNSPVVRILSQQDKDGFWGKPENFYVYGKYKGTTFTFLLLAELGADGNDDRIKKSTEFLFNHSYVEETGGFSFHCDEQGKGLKNDEGPCLTGKMVWALIKFGYLNDPGTIKAIDWLITYSRCDDGNENNLYDYPYVRIPSGKPKNCWGKHTCYRNVFWRLKALSLIPEDKRNKKVKKVIEESAEFILKHHIFKQSHNLSKTIKDSWMQFIFPTFAEIDVLQVLDTMVNLGYKDQRMTDAIEYVLSKRSRSGRWILDRSLNDRIRANFDCQGQESKWITYKAIKVLKEWDNLK